MSEFVICEKSDLVNVADAIREKTGKAEGMTIEQMAVEIEGISGGSGGGAASGDGWVSGIPYKFDIIKDAYIVKADGSLEPYQGWDATDYIPCHGVMGLVQTKYQTYAAFYDADYVHLSTVAVSGGLLLSVPETAYYYRASERAAEMDSYGIMPVAF